MAATTSKNLKSRCVKAASRYLELNGYEIARTNWECETGSFDIIAWQDGTLVFANVFAIDDASRGFVVTGDADQRRERFEKAALCYLAEVDDVDMPVRYDEISVVVVGPDRAMLKHFVNATCA